MRATQKQRDSDMKSVPRMMKEQMEQANQTAKEARRNLKSWVVKPKKTRRKTESREYNEGTKCCDKNDHTRRESMLEAIPAAAPVPLILVSEKSSLFSDADSTKEAGTKKDSTVMSVSEGAKI